MRIIVMTAIITSWQPTANHSARTCQLAQWHLSA